MTRYIVKSNLYGSHREFANYGKAQQFLLDFFSNHIGHIDMWIVEKKSRIRFRYNK